MPTLSPAAGPAVLPSSDAVRRAALARSWQRDRRVGRRRLAWRWTLWGLWRYGPPVGAAALLAAALWLLLRPSPPADPATGLAEPSPAPAVVSPPPRPVLRLRLDASPPPPLPAPSTSTTPSEPRPTAPGAVTP